nr:unnamed protein product [Spirometra erinaceieuropaei]
MVRQLHGSMLARVTDNGAVSVAFAVTNGVKQGCVLASTLLSLLLSAMMLEAYRDERPGICIAYKTGDQRLNHRRMHFQSRLSTSTVHELIFADDCALNVTSEEDIRRHMDLFAAVCNKFGLSIHLGKAVVMHQPPPDAVFVESQIIVNGTKMQVVDNFTYLGRILSRKTKIDAEVAR